jgi:hypothetical protein
MVQISALRATAAQAIVLKSYKAYISSTKIFIVELFNTKAQLRED